jgi:phosphotransferase system enzyme I (PtsP)
VGAEGFAFGDSVVFLPLSLGDSNVPEGRKLLTVDDFRRAVVLTEKELYEMQKTVEKKLLDVVAFIFSAQIMMLKDQAMIGAMEIMIGKGIPPQDAVRNVVLQYVARFDQMTNEYVREKRYDVIDVGRRILTNMVGRTDSHDQYAAKVVIVRELLPSDVLKLSLQNVAGIVLLSGGITSHVAVLARSLNIPLVIVDEPRLLNLKNGSSILLDAATGNISIEPSGDVIRAFRERQTAYADVTRIQKGLLDETRMKDGTRVVLLANINLLADLDIARAFKAEGVGLYRTEFPFLLRGDFPSEEEQLVIYRRLVEDMKGREITFRTLDIGGDKMLSYFDNSKEPNPFLGLRSIRFSLKHLDIFICQIRAILRASFDADVRIMFPMISSVEEFMIARDLVRESVVALKAEGKPHQAKPSIGAMIEVPSILEVIDELVLQADFLSIGTNDLIQYMLAVDRTNEKVADCYFPHHPAVLRSMKRVADAAQRHQRDISVCGDMAHDPRYIPFLIGIGIRKFSLDARYLPKIQQCIVGIDAHEAEVFAAELLGRASVNETAYLLDQKSSITRHISATSYNLV